MKYAIVPIEWCAARGILVTPEERKSVDLTLVIKHLGMLAPYVRQEWKDGTVTLDGMDDERVKVYSFDSKEFMELLASPEWTSEEEEQVTSTSDYGVIAGLVNAEAAIKSGIQTMELTDEESLEMKSMYPEWESKMGQQVNVGEKYQYGRKLWKVLQAHTVQENWKPGEGTESLYTEVSKGHAGTKEDPIPYDNNMELENGKYYSQDGVTYLCTRDTEIPVYQPLADLVGIYVEVSE